jgi:hypothetical protein
MMAGMLTLTKWQIVAMLVMALGMGFAFGASFGRKTTPVPLSVKAIGIAIMAVGVFVMWRTRNDRKPPLDDSQESSELD